MQKSNLQYQRNLEIKILLDQISGYIRENAAILEIGAGRGYQAESLALLGRVIQLDLVLPEGKPNDYVVGNGEQLPFKKEAFDVIFSSHVVEHIENRELFFNEVKRVAKATAYHIHVVPTQVWKFLADLDYYPLTIYNGVKKIFKNQLFNDKPSNNHRSEKYLFLNILMSKLLPPVHGTSRNLLEEYINFQPKKWRKCFQDNGFEIVKEIPLLTYSPPELMLIPPNRFLSLLGFPSSVAFLLSEKHSVY